MRKILFICISAIFILFSCDDTNVPEEQVVIVDPTSNNMKLIPNQPTINDVIRLVIFNDCKYNQLSSVTIKSNNILITKQFNSMMMLPCMIQNDTINIGKLTAGNYLINYHLIDVAKLNSPVIKVNLYYNLLISK